MKFKFSIIFILFVGLIFLAKGSEADTVYFKNGFKTEGEVRRTPEGVWVNGGLFQENEIEKIEGGSGSGGNTKGESWFSSVMSNFGKEKPKRGKELERERQASLEAYRRRMGKAPPPSNNSASPLVAGVLQQMMGGSPGLQPGAGQPFMQDPAMMQHAQQLQRDAQLQQMRMQEQMRAVEGGMPYPAGNYAAPQAYPQVEVPNVYPAQYPTTGTRGNSSSNDSYDYKPKKKNPLKKSIKFNSDGSTSWE